MTGIFVKDGRKNNTKLSYERITRMLKVAAYEGYKVLVLGAFGCGDFGTVG